MNDPTILFCRPKAVSPADKKLLKEAGIIVVTVEDPAAVRLTKAAVDISGSVLLSAALKIIANHTCSIPKEQMMKAVADAMVNK